MTIYFSIPLIMIAAWAFFEMDKGSAYFHQITCPLLAGIAIWMLWTLVFLELINHL